MNQRWVIDKRGKEEDEKVAERTFLTLGIKRNLDDEKHR